MMNVLYGGAAQRHIFVDVAGVGSKGCLIVD